MTRRVRTTVLAFVLAGAAYASYSLASGADAQSNSVAQDPAAVPDKKFHWAPFVDSLQIPSVLVALPQLPFRPSVPLALGAPRAVYIHEGFRPQALGLVYRGSLGQFVVTEESINISHDEQVNALRTLAASCNPATGCEGSWSISTLRDGTTALVISHPPDGNTAVIFIRGTTRFQVMGPSSTLTVPNALTVATTLSGGA